MSEELGLRVLPPKVTQSTDLILVMCRAPLKAVQELLGHSTIEMTMRYSHLSPDVLKDAVKLLDAVPPDSRLTTASFSNLTS